MFRSILSPLQFLFHITPAKIKFLQYSSSCFAVLGGILLASNTPSSGYGFIFLALSSGQMLLASLFNSDSTMICYSGGIFVFVDCLGIYRWVLS